MRLPSAAVAVGLFLVVAAPLYVVLLGRHGVTEGDTLYHFRLASWILRDGPWVDVRWLPFTVLGERGPDHHWLWHVALAPFALIPDPEQAIAIAAAATCGLVAVAALFIFRAFGVPRAALAAILLIAADGAMPERLTRLRAENVVYIALPLALLLMARRRSVALFLLSWIFMESYHGAVFLVPMLAAYAVGELLVHRTVAIRQGIAVLGGLAAGLIANPWFPRNIDYLMFHVLFKLRSENTLLIGTEWRAPPWIHIVRLGWLDTLLLACGIAAFLRGRFFGGSARLSSETIAALLLTGLSFGLFLTAYRWGLYYALFALVAAALLVRDSRMRVDRPGRAAVLAGLGLAAVALLFAIDVRWLAKIPPDTRSTTRFARMAAYLQDHARDGDVVVNLDWTTFTYLLWQADRLRYVAGLDGNYLAYGDPARFRTWFAIDRGKMPEGGASRALRKTFGSEWVIVPRSAHYDKVAMAIIDGGEAETRVLNGDGWLLHLGPLHDPRPP